jgi:cellulose synthase/poly-beta-1,6-N-acetylglucosamine synthase-like glycosyltransferase
MWILAGVVLALFGLFTIVPLFLSLLAKLAGEVKVDVVKEGSVDFACVVTVYKDVDCAINLLHSLLQQEYQHYHVYLVADDCGTVSVALQNERLSVYYPEQALHSKVKSIHYALDRLARDHSHFIVFDPDNLAHPQFLSEMNLRHQQGFEIIQGQRTAKNLDTKYACLDAFSEYYYNYTQRAVPFQLGSSATIAGSAMSLPVGGYLKFIKDEFEKQGDKLVIAEDKMLQVYVVKQGFRIAYAENAVVYDEKVSTAAQVKRQRTRWITSYVQYLATGLGLFWDSLLAFNWNQLLFAYTIVIPPMFIIGLTWVMLSVLSVFFSWSYFMDVQWCFAAFVLNIFVALILGKAPAKVVSSLFFAPLFVLSQVKALFSMKDTKTSFLTTEKTKNVSVEEVMNSKQ